MASERRCPARKCDGNAGLFVVSGLARIVRTPQANLKEKRMRKASAHVAATASVLLLLVNGVLILGSMALADSTPKTWKQCGNADGTPNVKCPKCDGNCKMDWPRGGGVQSYRICADEGTDCKMPEKDNAFCSGLKMDGGNDGKGCKGSKVGTCKYMIKKCKQA
jgi:hypothetical protein